MNQLYQPYHNGKPFGKPKTAAEKEKLEQEGQFSHLQWEEVKEPTEKPKFMLILGGAM